MKSVLFILGLASILVSCKKVVDVDNPYADQVEYCRLDPRVSGNWISDSIRIETEVDTVDSMVVDRFPTLLYELKARCGETKRFELIYYNYAGVETIDVSSSNFETESDRLFTYSQYRERIDTTEAQFRMSYRINENGQLIVRYKQRPNAGQVTRYTLFLSPQL